ncbi:hypothetical protein [Novipirellula artificiosorum]|uniref:Urease accessory protein UreH-like transmembrane domain-containing protein n=1 Tax=Novipirellula artificiosorum TaxID=2528016 RepID=A0A5C6DZ48_9BACT|nr:hypothetical protein [Novipirellula artificiosorum]TWU41832.1 hypothetical protein Poly41_01240 [Novipirellula artificiosorum]
MSNELSILCVAAVTIAFVHTLLGPDHYAPFVAMSRAGAWSWRKTMTVTVLCGVGHVVGSIVVGLLGISFGVVVTRLEWFEGVRGNVAGWLLVGFGLMYMVWGIVQAVRGKTHSHAHVHADGTLHAHPHDHHVATDQEQEHCHVHASHLGEPANHPSLTPWVLFTIFVFGPCEPLIPLLMYPAAKSSWWGVSLVAILFSVVTIATMTAIVAALVYGTKSIRIPWLERFGHATAGFIVTACGIAVTVGL